MIKKCQKTLKSIKKYWAYRKDLIYRSFFAWKNLFALPRIIKISLVMGENDGNMILSKKRLQKL